eukprot:16022816-Heterocapsa_arctica.AAC.1
MTARPHQHPALLVVGLPRKRRPCLGLRKARVRARASPSLERRISTARATGAEIWTSPNILSIGHGAGE